jgi:hypothetical protein
MVAFVLAIALTATSIGAVWDFATHDKNDWAINHSSLAPAIAYFDYQRDTLPV